MANKKKLKFIKKVLINFYVEQRLYWDSISDEPMARYYAKAEVEVEKAKSVKEIKELFDRKISGKKEFVEAFLG